LVFAVDESIRESGKKDRGEKGVPSKIDERSEVNELSTVK